MTRLAVGKKHIVEPRITSWSADAWAYLFIRSAK